MNKIFFSNKSSRQLMMKLFFLILLLSFGNNLRAQSNIYYMIFSTSGNIYLSVNKTKTLAQMGDKLVQSNILIIEDGIINLLDHNNKRITINKKGNYTFDEISNLFIEANASLTNKYLTFIWENMNHTHEQIQQKAGVERTDFITFAPLDSAIILSDTLRLKFVNPKHKYVSLIIFDTIGKAVFMLQTDSNLIVLTKSESSWWKSGFYNWIIKSAENDDICSLHFFIPEEKALYSYAKEWKQIQNAINQLPESERSTVIDDILKMTKWIW